MLVMFVSVFWEFQSRRETFPKLCHHIPLSSGMRNSPFYLQRGCEKEIGNISFLFQHSPEFLVTPEKEELWLNENCFVDNNLGLLNHDLIIACLNESHLTAEVDNMWVVCSLWVPCLHSPSTFPVDSCKMCPKKLSFPFISFPLMKEKGKWTALRSYTDVCLVWCFDAPLCYRAAAVALEFQ